MARCPLAAVLCHAFAGSKEFESEMLSFRLCSGLIVELRGNRQARLMRATRVLTASVLIAIGPTCRAHDIRSWIASECCAVWHLHLGQCLGVHDGGRTDNAVEV